MNFNGVFMSWIGGLKDITGSWSASMRVAGSFAIIAASLLAIENVIARGQRRKSEFRKEVQCDKDVSWSNSFLYKVPWNRPLVYHTTDFFCCWWLFCVRDFESLYWFKSKFWLIKIDMMMLLLLTLSFWITIFFEYFFPI